ncbi:MAG: multiheme c-type cytochrome [Candidatus Zixiibacteriota bacterium]
MDSPRIPKQILSLTFLFAIVIAALVVARMLLVPHSFGRYGHYRADAVNEIIAQKINYAGYEACIECHDEIYEPKEKSHHKGVSCEACHGPAAKHVEAPDQFVPEAPRKRGYCPLCHGYNPSRPTGFPQIITELHNPGQACMTCHNPHSPLLPHTPEECSACHREIANKKRVSHHALLSCVRCHSVPEEHLINPKFALAQKPTEREFCGECHAADAKADREIPRIDLDTHGERYLCWDCHYAHHPEAR